jgi:hypothetical protein
MWRSGGSLLKLTTLCEKECKNSLQTHPGRDRPMDQRLSTCSFRPQHTDIQQLIVISDGYNLYFDYNCTYRNIRSVHGHSMWLLDFDLARFFILFIYIS